MALLHSSCTHGTHGTSSRRQSPTCTMTTVAPAGPRVNGRFLEADGRRFLVKGVTYGTFAPDQHGGQYPLPAQIDEDFRLMAQAGFNTVRVYTVPETGLLDTAARHGLRVMVGVPWTQHVAFLGDRALTRGIREQMASTVRDAGVAPGGVDVRRRQRDSAVGRPLARPGPHRALPPRSLRRGEAGVADSLLTYVNFPPTEYLDLDCYDVCSFNVYLHAEADLRAYLARLQHVAGAQAVPAGGGRRRQPARRARRPGGHHGDARAGRVRGRRLRRGGVRLDRRVVARRPPRWTTGVRPRGQGAPAEAGAARSCRGRSPRRRSRPMPGPAGRRCRWWSAPTTPPTPSTSAWRR